MKATEKIQSVKKNSPKSATIRTNKRSYKLGIKDPTGKITNKQAELFFAMLFS